MNFILQIIAIVLVSFSILLSIVILTHLHWPAPVLFLLKLYSSALSPVLCLIGLLCSIAGLITGSIFISIPGLYVFLFFGVHLFRISRPPTMSTGFEQAFGLHWEKRINAEQQNHFLSHRSILKLPVVPAPRMEQNISFGVIPGSDRNLLCDIWQPAASIPHSGLAFIYMHGSAWYFLDKDLGTRPFFRHLASQGHVVMDVAYRFAPETTMMGMVHDVKRAINRMKENADNYGVNQQRIVVGGGSSGGHLALLAAFTEGNNKFIPDELKGKDLNVCGVVSLYGPSDLVPMYYHTNQHLTTRTNSNNVKKAVPRKMPGWIIKSMGKEYYRLHMDKDFAGAGAFASILGCHPDECPKIYELYSPVNHVHPNCPNTLLIHGEHDLMAPVTCTRHLYSRLVEKKVPSVLHILPQTDHAFDLIVPQISPAAHNAIYDVERFLALQIKLFESVVTKTKKDNLISSR